MNVARKCIKYSIKITAPTIRTNGRTLHICMSNDCFLVAHAPGETPATWGKINHSIKTLGLWL